jgi:hypothetical protein
MGKSSIPDVVVLAAIDRAARHGRRETVPVWIVFEHLGIPRRSRLARAQLYGLEEAGLVGRSRVRGTEMWSLTPVGRKRLRRAGVVVLPESPQHRAWRHARGLAAGEIDRFRAEVRQLAGEMLAMLDEPAGSDAWFALARRLRAAVWRLGSATHCLSEWQEPSEDRSDIDDHIDPSDDQLPPGSVGAIRARRAGRRNTWLWSQDPV